MRNLVALIILYAMIPFEASACSCIRYFSQEAAAAARSDALERIAQNASVFRGAVVTGIDLDERRGERIQVIEPLIGETPETVQLWTHFLEQGILMNSCMPRTPPVGEEHVFVVFPFDEAAALDRSREIEAGATDYRSAMPNAPADQFFTLVDYCTMRLFDLDATMERARELGRAH
ncbi:hypothetical protein [Parasphingopyxis sp.]|uniref:hypothetical protein n=1 Tax=Parasphingopyxis sp. TaxID=1920299 RepID=UPI002637CE9C|nr:hypothetical protein [Parasphingopyxis sp.]